jgi:hypothetical protein
MAPNAIGKEVFPVFNGRIHHHCFCSDSCHSAAQEKEPFYLDVKTAYLGGDFYHLNYYIIIPSTGERIPYSGRIEDVFRLLPDKS